jgi:hypothetical protein
MGRTSTKKPNLIKKSSPRKKAAKVVPLAEVPSKETHYVLCVGAGAEAGSIVKPFRTTDEQNSVTEGLLSITKRNQTQRLTVLTRDEYLNASSFLKDFETDAKAAHKLKPITFYKHVHRFAESVRFLFLSVFLFYMIIIVICLKYLNMQTCITILLFKT